MHRLSVRSRTILLSTFLLLLIVGLIGINHLPPQVEAQSGVTLVWGEPQLGEVNGPDGTFYVFQGTAGEAATIDVIGLGNFHPAITLFDANRNVLAQNDNPTQANIINVSATLPQNGTYSVQVRGVGSSVGQFTIILDRNLPPGIPLVANIPMPGSVSPDLATSYYDFSLAPDRSAHLEIRSLTQGYSPAVTVYDGLGEVAVSMYSRKLSAISLEFEPGNEILKLAVERGSYQGRADFRVLLTYVSPGPGPDSTAEPEGTAEATACFITANQDANVRSGGSTSHSAIALMRGGETLPVLGYNPANEGWYQVRLSNGVIGWVFSGVVASSGICVDLPLVGFTAPAATEDAGPASTPDSTPDDDDHSGSGGGGDDDDDD